MGDTKKKSIRLNMTGEEFKRLIEQYDPDNEVNTLPEVLRLLQGIGDNESLADYIERKINEGVTVIPAGSVGPEQLNDEVKENMLTPSDRVTEEELADFEV